MVDRDTLTLTETGHVPEIGGAYVDAETVRDLTTRPELCAPGFGC
jgi:hypothetical protein